jgi:hypothetical protein
MATVDSLDIKISAQAKSASDSIDKLVSKLGTLSRSLGSISGSNLSGLANGVNKLASATKSLSGVKASEFTRIANGFQKFANIDATKLNSAAGGLNTLARSLEAISKISNLQNITPAINAIKNLARVDMTGFDTAKMNAIATTIADFANKLSAVGNIDSKVVRLVSAIARLSGTGQYIGNVTVQLPILGNQIVALVRSLSTVGTIDVSISKVVEAIAKLASAGKKVGETVSNLDDLGDGVIRLLQKLQSAPNISDNIANTIQGLGNLANAGRFSSGMFSGVNRGASGSSVILNGLKKVLGGVTGGFKKMFSAIGNSAPFQKLTNTVRKFVPWIKSANSTSKGFVSTIGMFYAKCFMLIRAFKQLGNSIESAMDYIETYNYFQAAFNQVASKADLSAWKELGYKSAQEYANSFQQTAENLTSKLTGFNVGKNGQLTATGQASLGLDPNLTMNYQAMFAQMSSSMGVASDTATQLSTALTEIGADLASVKNLDFEDTWEDMASGLTGMSRTWDKYGVNIRNANLQTQLNNLGIKANISNLNQNDKALLRTITLLDSTRYAWGDMASTISQPANQLRLLKNNLTSISRAIGQIFLPVVQKILPYLNGFAIAVRNLVTYVGSLLGVDMSLFKDTGSDNSAISDLLDDEEDLSSAIDDSTESQKKFNKQLQGFDKLNNMTTSTTSSSSSGDDDSATNVTDKLTSALNDMLSDYQKVWNQKFKEMQNAAEKFAEKLTNLFKSAWKSGDGTDIGTLVAAWINKGINWVNEHMSEFSSTLKKMAGLLATAFNGFVNQLDWKGLGKAIGNSIKAVLEAEKNFFEKVDWTNLGSSLATSLNSAIKTGVLESYFSLIADKIRAAIELAFGAIETFDFKSLGTHLKNGINDFLDTMSKKNKNTKLTGWQELGKGITDGLSGIIDAITEALGDITTWDKVGQAISDLIGSIDFGKVTWKLGKLVSSLATGLYTIVSKKSAWTELGSKIADGINKFFKSMNQKNKDTGMTGWETLGATIGDSIKGLANSITTALKNVHWEDIGVAIADFLKGLKWKEILSSIKDVLASAIKGLFKMAIAAIKKNPSDVLSALLILAKIFTFKRLMSKFGALKGIFKKVFATLITRGLTASAPKIKLSDKLKKRFSVLGTKLGRAMGVAMVAAYGFWENSITAGGDAGDVTSTYTSGTDEKSMLLKQVQELTDKFGYSNTTKQAYLISSLSKAIESGSITEKQLKKALEKDYKSFTSEQKEQSWIDFANAVGLGNDKNVTGSYNTSKGGYYAKSITYTTKYRKAIEKLQKKLSKLNVTSSDNIEIQKDLKEKLESGEISWEQYKKIVDGNYTSAKDLKKAIKNLKSKSVKVKATTSGKKDVEEVQTTIKKTKGKSVKVKATTSGKKDVDNLKDSVNNTDNKEVTVEAYTIGGKAVDDLASTISSVKDKTAKITADTSSAQTTLGKLPSYVPNMTFKPKADTTDAETKLKNIKAPDISLKAKVTTDKDLTVGAKVNKVSLTQDGKTAKNNLLNGSKMTVSTIVTSTGLQTKLDNGSAVKTSIKAVKIRLPKAMNTANALAQLPWAQALQKNGMIEYYKKGGYPTKADLFYANENGKPEFIGRQGNNPVVANNDQIVTSVAGGVSDAVYNVLNPVLTRLATSISAMNSGQNSGNALYVEGVSDGDIVKIVSDANTKNKKRTGKPLFA